MDWKNKVAVITGAGGVLCGEIAKEYAAMGAKVALLDINLAAAQKVADEIKNAGGVAVAYKADCLDKASLQAAHECVLKDLGACDLLVNGAGGNSPKGTATKEQHERIPSPYAYPRVQRRKGVHIQLYAVAGGVFRKIGHTRERNRARLFRDQPEQGAFVRQGRQPHRAHQKDTCRHAHGQVRRGGRDYGRAQMADR